MIIAVGWLVMYLPLHFVFQGRGRKECPFPGCDASVVNVPRHVRSHHPEESWKRRPKDERQRPQKKCHQCGAITTRMDLHLTKAHKLARGTTAFTKLLDSATIYVPPPKDTDTELMDSVMNEYR